jgi:arylsulfatase A-like enzyme
MIVREQLAGLGRRALGALLCALIVAAPPELLAQQPNIVIINIDDMGWGDFAVYGSQHSQTPNIDSLAAQGTRFTQFYSGAPICSPSRASLFTGQYAARSNITTFINNSQTNLLSDNANHLSLDAPSIAQTFDDAGYATGHFGKWHLGGGRDIGYAAGTTPGTNATAPRIVEYGYDEAWTQMEGLANRIINVDDYGGDADGVSVRPSGYMNGLNQDSEARGRGVASQPGGLDQLVYLEREFNGEFMVNKAINFIDATKSSNPSQPFFMNVWLDEVHTPHDPPQVLEDKYDLLYSDLPAETRDYLAMLEHTDQLIGRLVDHIDGQGLGDDTLILVMADNGAVQVNADNINSTGPFRGTKGDLFEGGFRQPLIARWTGNVAANRTDTQTVMWMPDLFPTLTDIAGVANPAGVEFDGEDLSDALLGSQFQTRTNSLFWNMNRGTSAAHSNPNATGAGANGEEAIALRSGNWKLLINAQGTAPELYDLSNDVGETTNLAAQHPQVVAAMASEALEIRYETPSRTIPDTATPIVRLKAGDLTASLANGAAVASWSDSATGDSFNGTVTQGTSTSRPTLLTNVSDVNGKAVVAFDGGDSLGSSTTNSLPNVGRGITVFAVGTGDTSGQTAERLGQIGDSGGASGQIAGFDVSTTATGTSNGGAGFRFNNGASLYDTPIADTGFHIVVWQIDDGQAYSNATMFVDGTVPANTFTGSSTTANSIGFAGSDLELLLGTGRNTNGALATSDFFSGQLAEMLVYNEQLSVGQINLVANYLSTEYGLDFAYETNLDLFSVVGLAWNGGTANFDSAWNGGNGVGGPAGANTNPFSGGTQDLYLGNGGVAEFNNATNTTAGSNLNSLRIGTPSAGFIITGTGGNGTLTATGSKSLTIGDGAAPATGEVTGDLIVGESGQTGTLNWGSTGTLKIEGRLRIGEAGTGIVNQTAGIVTAGDVTGQLKFIAVGSGIGGNGTYNLANGRFLPGGGSAAGAQLRHLRIGYNGADGTVIVGDGDGDTASASIESRDDLYLGYDGGTGNLTLHSDGQVRLVSDGAHVYVGFNDGSNGTVMQHGGTFSSEGEFVIGQNAGSQGLYELHGGTLHTADDTTDEFRIGHNGGNGTLRVAGTGVVIHEGIMTIGDGAQGTRGALEMIGSTASVTTSHLESLDDGATETMRWVADVGGVSPIVVTTGMLMGDGVALSLDLSALTGDHTLTLINNQTSQATLEFFQNPQSLSLYEEGDNISDTAFNGSVTISYVGGTGNDVTLSLVASTDLTGDYNRDGVVDGADYVMWRKLGTNGMLGYTQWQQHFGESQGGSGNSQVPEPASCLLAMTAIAATGLIRFRRSDRRGTA